MRFGNGTIKLAASSAAAASHAVSTLSGAQHDPAQRTSAATQRSISRQDAKAAKQVDSELGVLGALARANLVSKLEE
jgi:hypothetical protein